MEPVELRIIARDETKAGFQSAEGNMSVLEKQVQQQSALIGQLEKELKQMQASFTSSTASAVDQTENINVIEALKKKIDELKVKLEELKNQNENTTLIPPSLPKAISSYNGLGMSVQQIARELPSLAMGPQMFFLAISNNLPIFTDQLKIARAEFEALKNAGQTATPVWKQVLKSIVSWQTAMVVLITLAIAYSKDVITFFSNMNKAGTAIDATKTRLDVLNKTLESYKKNLASSYAEYGKQVAIVTRLSSEWSKLGNNLSDKKKFIDQNKSSFSQLGIEVNGVKDAENLLVGNTASFVEAMKLRAQAMARQATLQELYAKAQAAHDDADSTEVWAKARRGKVYKEDQKEADKINLSTKIATVAAKLSSPAAALALPSIGAVTPQEVAANAADALLKKAEKSRLEEKAALGQIEKITQDMLRDFAKSSELLSDAGLEEENKGKNKGNNRYIDSYNLNQGSDKATQANKDAILKMEIETQQAQIDLMKEGSDKQLAQIRLNYDKRFSEIRKGERDALQLLQDEERKQWEKDNPDHQKKNLQFKPKTTVLPTNQQEDFGKQYSLAYQQREKDEKDLTESLLKKYQDYTDQRIAIEQKYNADLAALQAARKKAEADGNDEEVAQIDRAIVQNTTNKGKDLMGLDYEQLKQTPDYVRAFENLKETSSDTLDSLLSQLENAKQTATQVLSPDQLREYTTTIQEIMDELDSRNPFGALADRKKELAEAEAALATAQQQLNAVQGGAQIVTGVKNTKFNGKTGKIDSEKTYLTTTKAMENYNKAQDNVTKKGAKVKKAEKEVKDVMDDLFDSIKDVGDAIGGPAGEIISLIGDIGLFAMTAMSGVSTASETASKSIQAVEKASVILAIIGAAIQIAMKIASLFKDDDGVAAYEDAKEVYESYIDILDRVIEKQKELFDLNNKTGQQAYEKAKETVKKQEGASRELGKQYLNSGASKGFLGIGSSASKGVEQKDDMSWKAKEEAKKALGQSGYNRVMDGRMTGLFDLSAKQLADLQEKAPLFWAELHDDTKTYLEQIIACGDELKQIENDRKEGLTKIDFDSFYSGFLDTLSDMDASSEDFANSFEDYLKNAILSSLITNEYKTRIQALYDNWASYTQSGEKLTEQEVEALRKEQQAISDEMLRKREELAKTFGWQSEAEKEQQSGKAGAFTTMSQDQGTKLEGLFTSVQGHVSNMDDLLKDIAMAMYEAFDTLLRIEANTAYCKHLEQMAEDIAELKRDGFKMK